jgi:ribonuclease D
MISEDQIHPILITRPGSLRDLAADLSRQSLVAVDTESNSLHAYREQVCLIQFSTEETDYLVDPLSLDDLSCLGPIFANPDIEKIFHAAEYDLICLKRDFGFRFANIFDTMVAASILGKPEIGLASILESEFGLNLDKRFQRADWGRRPLSADLIDYARLDTHYLIILRNQLMDELHQSGRWPLAEEDFIRMCLISNRAPENGNRTNSRNGSNGNNEPCWRINGANDLTPQQAAVLQELCIYRDQVARTLNRPLFKVISDETLLSIAANTPGSLEALSRIRGMTRGQIRRHGHALLQAVERGQQAPPLFYTRSPRPDDQFISRLDHLRQWRKKTAEQLGVKSDVVLARDLLFALAEQNPTSREEIDILLGEVPWRREHFGDQILKVLLRKNKGSSSNPQNTP